MNINNSFLSKKASASRLYPGMFDLLKGWGMLSIMITHTINHFGREHLLEGRGAFIMAPVLDIWKILSIGEALMAIFFIISGFSFKKTSPISCLKKQAGYILKPLLWTILFSTALSFLTALISTRGLNSALSQAFSVLLGFLLGCTEGTTIHTIFLPGMYASWFLMALFFAYNILNLILYYVPEKIQFICVAAVALLGYLGGKYISPNYALAPGMLGVLFLYVGYLIKRHKFLTREISVWLYVLFFILGFIQARYSLVSMSIGQWYWGLTDVVISTCSGIVLIHLFLLLNKYSNPIFTLLRFLGRYSLWILCIHTVEYLGIPWSSFVYSFTPYMTVNIFIFIMLRLFLVILCLKLLIAFHHRMGHAS